MGRTTISNWLLGCSSIVFASACGGAGRVGEGEPLDVAFKKGTEVPASAVVGLDEGSTLVQGLLLQPVDAGGLPLGPPLRAPNLDADTMAAALAEAGHDPAALSAVELSGYLATRVAGTFKFKLESDDKSAPASLRIDVTGDGVPDQVDAARGVQLTEGAHPFQLRLPTQGRAPAFKKAEGELKEPLSAKLKPLPDALFARDPDVPCALRCAPDEELDRAATFAGGQPCEADAAHAEVNAATCESVQGQFSACCVPRADGGASDGGPSTDAGSEPAPDAGAGDDGSSEGGDGGEDPGTDQPPATGDAREPWCVGEDTDERPARDLSYCDLCGGRELRVENWRNDGPCLEAWSEVAFTRGDSPECVAASNEMMGLCCLGFRDNPLRAECTELGPYPPVDLCDDGCFPSHPARAGVYSLQAGGPLAPWVNSLGDRRGTCYADDGASPGALVWSCRRAYYLLKYGHLPPAQAAEVVSWWSGHHALSADCGCDDENTNNPAHP